MTEENNKTERPPIIVIMGHVDHGKSALLDYIRKSNIVAGEAGGITQHVSAYEVVHANAEGLAKKITFLDTPGHEAFTQMRMRGATVADIAVLVVSAEDGVKTQTLEALKAIMDGGIPYIVAINKIDKPDADVERTKMNLVENGIYLEGMGGDIPYVPISAKAGTGINDLLDLMLLAAEMEELTSEIDVPAEGVIIESHIDPKKGISSSLIIKNGTLKKGMCIVSGKSVAPVRIFENFLGKKIDEATSSSPVRITGWNIIPTTGDSFVTFETKKEAEKYASKQKDTCAHSHATSDNFTDGDEMTIFPVVIKADVSGTLEAVEQEIAKINIERVCIRITHKGVGEVNENDIKLIAGTTKPTIIAFTVGTDSKAIHIAEQAEITIKQFNIIYKMVEWIEKEAKARQKSINVEEKMGMIRVIKVFSKQKNAYVLGGKVKEGELVKNTQVNIIRNDETLGTGKVVELQQQKITTEKVLENNEFGAKIESDTEIHDGDILEAFEIIKK